MYDKCYFRVCKTENYLNYFTLSLYQKNKKFGFI